MQEVSPLAVSHSKNLQFDFSYTKRNERVNLNSFSSYNFIIDVDGKVYMNSPPSEQQATICVIGGDSTYIHEKANRVGGGFYMSQNQKTTIYAIVRDLSNYFNDSKVTSGNSDMLEQAVDALYTNYVG